MTRETNDYTRESIGFVVTCKRCGAAIRDNNEAKMLHDAWHKHLAAGPDPDATRDGGEDSHEMIILRGFNPNRFPIYDERQPDGSYVRNASAPETRPPFARGDRVSSERYGFTDCKVTRVEEISPGVWGIKVRGGRQYRLWLTPSYCGTAADTQTTP